MDNGIILDHSNFLFIYFDKIFKSIIIIIIFLYSGVLEIFAIFLILTNRRHFLFLRNSTLIFYTIKNN